MRLHKSGELAEAEQAYRRVLDANPRNPQALYLSGVVTGQLGRSHEAIELLQRAISLEPDHSQAISELAKLFRETGQLEASAETLRELILLRPDLGELHSNLGIVLRGLGKPEEAVAACEKAVELSPDSALAHFNLGDVLKGLHRFEEAAAAYRGAIALRPEMTEAYPNLAAALRNIDELDDAADVLKQWLRHDPDNPIAQHMVAAHCGKDTPTRASDGYVRRVFDEFAATFDNDLQELDYQGPRLIAEAVRAELGQGARGLDVLDAGCGTGLCGPSLRPAARRLVGVGLSSEMIQHARDLNLYDELVESELTEYLNSHPQEFDLIVAADTFNYFGVLEPLLMAAACALRAQGLLVFTLEQCEASLSIADYRLNLHGRYSHNEDYVKRCMYEHGLFIDSLESATLRKERNQPVPGIVVRARR